MLHIWVTCVIIVHIWRKGVSMRDEGESFWVFKKRATAKQGSVHHTNISQILFIFSRAKIANKRSTIFNFKQYF